MRRCCCRCDERTRPLWSAFVGNTVFTTAQVFGATFANSLAMFSDTSTMFVDSITYLVSLVAEHQRVRCGVRGAAAAELGASAFSVIALFAVTIAVTNDAARRITTHEEEEDVDPRIMLGFTIVNLFVDIFMCAPFVKLLRRRPGRRSGQSSALVESTIVLSDAPQASEPSESRAESRVVVVPQDGERSPRDEPAAGDGGGGLDLDASKELNLFSAFAHVFADTLRTLTVLTCALLVWVAGVPPETADAVGALIVSGIVLVITLYLAYETFVQLVAFVGGGRKHSTRKLPAVGASHEPDQSL